MLPVFGQLAGRRCLGSQPDKLVRQSLDAESVFDVIADCPKIGTPYFQFRNTLSPLGYTRIAVISLEFNSLQLQLPLWHCACVAYRPNQKRT
jgi:hypothetical protein